MAHIDLPFGWDDLTTFLDRVIDAAPKPTRASFADVVADVSGLGLTAGTPVIIALPTGRRLLEHYFAVLLTGAVPLTLSPATTAARISNLAQTVGAGAVIAVRVDPTRYGETDTIAVGDAQAVMLRSGRPEYHAGTVLMPTSGTSGLFSTCVHRIDSLIRNATRHSEAVGLRADDTVLINLPLFYSYAIVAQALAALVTGARLVISGPPFSPPAYPRLLSEYDVTSSSITPTIARLLLHRREKIPTALRMLTVGGDSLSARHVAGLLATAPGTELYITYGLTEAGPRVSTLAAHQDTSDRHASVGRPLPGVTATLRDVSDGEGELVVHTDTALLAKTGGSTPERTLISPGVVATGDRFRIDEDGYLYFTGRISDFIVVRGEKVSLSAIREYVQCLPHVVHCRTLTTTDVNGYTEYEMDVRLSESTGTQAEGELRRTILSYLLPGERPRALSIGSADMSALQK